jgi:hypothetical protein
MEKTPIDRTNRLIRDVEDEDGSGVKGWSLRLRGSTAKPLMFTRIDLGPQPDQLDPHGNDLVCKRPLWICAETVTAAKALNGAFNFRQGTGDRWWNDIRVMHMFI